MTNGDAKEAQEQEVLMRDILLLAAYRYAGGRLPEKEGRDDNSF